ncbi:hypothetical protein F2P56_008551, partial [Juglans regia]
LWEEGTSAWRRLDMVQALVEFIYGINNVRPIDGEINQSIDKATVATRIGQEDTILISEFDMLLHGKGCPTSAKMSTVSQDIESILLLVKKNATRGASHFQAEEIFEDAKILDVKLLR